MVKKSISNFNEAFEELKKGNERFASGLRSVHSLSTVYRMDDLATNGQRPFAIVISCSDSRAPAETIFDQGLGDLFVIRVAGNIINDDMIASLEFAALTFETTFCVVMGHTKCGAISATIAAVNGEMKIPSPALGGLMEKIQPSVLKFKNVTKSDFISNDLIERVTEENVKNSINQITIKSKIISDLIKNNKFQISPAVYDITTGKVNFC